MISASSSPWMRSRSVSPLTDVPPRPMAFRTVTSPPSRWIVDSAIRIKRRIIFQTGRTWRSHSQAFFHVTLQPVPELVKRTLHLFFDCVQFFGGKPLSGLRVAVGEHVKLDLRLRAGRAHGGAAAIGE